MHIPIIDTIRKNKNARDLIESAQNKYDKAQKRMDRQRQSTSECLGELGEIKLEVWSEDIGEFVRIYQFFKEVKIEGRITGKETMSIPLKPDWNIKEMQRVSVNAGEVIQGGLASVSAGALAGVASYGAVSMLGTASTGTAISALSGAAAHNATLAWFGGGALSAGGAGVSGGMLVLGGIVVVPIFLVADSIMYAKADEKLAKARQIYQEAKLAAEKMDTITDFMLHVESVSNGYHDFLVDFRRIYQSLLYEVRVLVQTAQEDNRRITFEELTLPQKRLLQITWLMTQVLYQVLKAPLLTKRGNLHRNAEFTLETAKQITGELENAYQTGSDISNGTVERIAAISKKESLIQKIRGFFEDVKINNTGNSNIGAKLSSWKQNFLHSGAQGFVSLAMLILAIFALLTIMIVPCIFWLFACYIAYPGVNLDGKPSVRITAAIVVFIIGLIL